MSFLWPKFPTDAEVLDCMRVNGWLIKIRGRDLRERLAERGYRMSGPGFYQFMVGLEDRGVVRGWNEETEIDGIVVRPRWYERLA